MKNKTQRVEINLTGHIVSSQQANIGDYMRLVKPINFSIPAGSVILRIYEGFVSLDQPIKTWGISLDVQVEILPPGTSITITILE